MDIDLFTNYLSDIKDRVLSEPIELFTNCTDVDEVLFYNNKIHIHFLYKCTHIAINVWQSDKKRVLLKIKFLLNSISALDMYVIYYLDHKRRKF